MARDTERYVYLTIGIPRDSETLQQFLHDAKECGMQRELPKLLMVRIADFYKQTATTLPTRSAPSSVIKATEAPEETMNEDIAALNANAALDEWG